MFEDTRPVTGALVDGRCGVCRARVRSPERGRPTPNGKNRLVASEGMFGTLLEQARRAFAGCRCEASVRVGLLL